MRIRLALFEIGAPSIWNWYDIPASGQDLPLLNSGDNRLFTINASKCLEFDSNIFPLEIRELQKDGNLTIEDLAKLVPKIKLVVYIFAYDSFSGSRKLFKSKTYGINDICYGQFKGLKMKK